MKIKVPFMPLEVEVKSFGNADVECVERAPFMTYSEQLLAQENRQTDTTKAAAITTYERDLLLHVKAAFTYFQMYRSFDGLMAQSFCGKLTEYEVVTEEVALKKTYHVKLVDVVFVDTPQPILLEEGQFLRTYLYETSYIYVIMENV